MPVTLIKQNPDFSKKVEGVNKLSISELFCDTIQGEGVSTGVSSTFLRLQGCTLKCTWCDTLSVWPNGNEYSFDEIFELFESVGLIKRLREGQHLILTGGSPLKQQEQLYKFLLEFESRYEFLPFIEIENEGVLVPNDWMISLIDQWNNSPKLANSGMKERVRYKPEILRQLSSFDNSWFKFVVECDEDWEEINEFFIVPDLIKKSQIILMPQGQTQEELNISRPIAADMAIKYGVRFSDRLHITLWNKRTGV
jgi:7-carboxy-7-deazaguanine synthase